MFFQAFRKWFRKSPTVDYQWKKRAAFLGTQRKQGGTNISLRVQCPLQLQRKLQIFRRPASNLNA